MARLAGPPRFSTSGKATWGRESPGGPDRLATFWRMRIGALPNSVFEVGYVDSRYPFLRDGVETLEEGTVDRAAVIPGG